MTTDFCFGFTGTRYGMTTAQRGALMVFLSGGSGEFHHGDCMGADAEAHDIAYDLGYVIVGHPPSTGGWRAGKNCTVLLPEKPYLARNRDIVDATIALIAAPQLSDEQSRGGTWSTVRYARKRGKPVVIIHPDGIIKQEMPQSRTEPAQGSEP